MNKSKIIELLSKDSALLDACKKLTTNNLYEDLYQELFVILLKYDEEKLIKVYNDGKIKWFAMKILFNQTYSNKSPFYTKYRKHTFDELKNKHLKIIDEQYDKSIDEAYKAYFVSNAEYKTENDSNWYRSELFDLYLKYGSLRAVNKATGIPMVSVFEGVKQFKNDIKKRINESITSSTKD